VYCDTGRRSSAGAYILAERDFHVSVLRGGMELIPTPTAQAV